MISDLAADVGLSFTPLSSATIEAVESYLDPGMEATNPLDYWGDGANVMAPVLTEMSKDPAVGIVVMATNMLPGRAFAEMSAAAIRDVQETIDKPVAVYGQYHDRHVTDHCRRFAQPWHRGVDGHGQWIVRAGPRATLPI